MNSDPNSLASNSGPFEQAEILVSGDMVLDALKLRLVAMVAPLTWRRTILQVARSLDSGTTLAEAFAARRGAMPSELVSIFQEALRTPDPAGLLLEALTARKEARDSWHELATLVAYPLSLFVFAICVAVAFSYVMQSMVQLDWIDEFGLTGLEYIESSIQDQHHAIVGLGMITAWTGLTLLTIGWVGPAWAWLAVIGGVILIGRPLRWLHLRELLCRFQMFISQGLNTSDAASAVSRSFVSGGQSVVAKAIAQRIDAGVPLGKSFGLSMLSDGLCRPALLMLDSSREDLPQALGRTSDLIGRLAAQRCQALATLLPMFGMLLVGSIIWASISSYMQMLIPLISLITSLA